MKRQHSIKIHRPDNPVEREQRPQRWCQPARWRRRADTYTSFVKALYWTVKLAGVIPWWAFGPWPW